MSGIFFLAYLKFFCTFVPLTSNNQKFPDLKFNGIKILAPELWFKSSDLFGVSNPT